MLAGCRKTRGLSSPEEQASSQMPLVCPHSRCLSSACVAMTRLPRWFPGVFCHPAVMSICQLSYDQTCTLQKTTALAILSRQIAKIHEGGDASGSQTLLDEPLCAVPIETFC